MDLQQRLIEARGEFLFFALTPPKATTSYAKTQEIADAMTKRLQSLELDGLVLYDIDDESERNPKERPFPFLPTMDPADFLSSYLDTSGTPVVVYRSVGKYDENQLRDWLDAQKPERTLTVFVGSPSRERAVKTSLTRAHALRTELNSDLLLGGVAIPERHARTGGEHERLIAKQQSGCSFFITQVIYDVNAAKNLVSDYHYECLAQGDRQVPIIFTMSVCGSMRTLEFLEWLGVDVPRWIRNELRHADDTLEASVERSVAAARELIAYCRGLKIPFGFNVESVSNRRVEIEASTELAARLREELRSGSSA